MTDDICDECEGEGGVHECPTCSYEVEGCGTCGQIEEDDGQADTVADLRKQLAEVTAERDATRADVQALNESKHMRQLRRFLKATESHRGWMGALSVNVGGVDVVVDYAALRAIVADIERIGGEA